VLIPLTETMLETIRRDYSTEAQKDVAQLLLDECGDNLPLLESGREREIERVRNAILKLSSGDVDKFLYWLDIAKRDWRDVLIGG
jgi:hypothetical protein